MTMPGPRETGDKNKDTTSWTVNNESQRRVPTYTQRPRYNFTG